MAGQAYFDRVADVINDAATELGQATTRLADPMAEQGALYVQLVALLGAAGRSLVREREWPQLRRRLVFNTLTDIGEYSTQFNDVLRIIDNTAWVGAQQWPLTGPLSDAQWQELVVRNITTASGYFFRIDGPKMTLYPTPKSVQQVSLWYRSRWWVQSVDENDISQDLPGSSDDTIWMDAALIKSKLKLLWMQAKQMDSTAVQAEYDRALDNACSVSTSASALVVGGRGGPRLLDYDNIPDGALGRP